MSAAEEFMKLQAERSKELHAQLEVLGKAHGARYVAAASMLADFNMTINAMAKVGYNQILADKLVEIFGLSLTIFATTQGLDMARIFAVTTTIAGYQKTINAELEAAISDVLKEGKKP